MRAACSHVLRGNASIYIDDAVQESFERYLRSYNSTNPINTDNKYYIYKIARNTSIDILRKNSRFVNTDNIASDTSDDWSFSISSEANIDSRHLFQRLMFFLPYTYKGDRRSRVLLLLVSGMKSGDIAKHLDTNNSIVSKDLRRIIDMASKIDDLYAQLRSVLSYRQNKVLICTIDGMKTDDIAKLLRVSDNIVKRDFLHIEGICRKVISESYISNLEKLNNTSVLREPKELSVKMNKISKEIYKKYLQEKKSFTQSDITRKSDSLWQLLQPKLIQAMIKALNTVIDDKQGITIRNEMKQLTASLLDYAKANLTHPGLQNERMEAEIRRLYGQMEIDRTEAREKHADADTLEFNNKVRRLRLVLDATKPLMVEEEGKEAVNFIAQVTAFLGTLDKLTSA